jgi:hypothetical protein
MKTEIRFIALILSLLALCAIPWQGAEAGRPEPDSEPSFMTALSYPPDPTADIAWPDGTDFGGVEANVTSVPQYYAEYLIEHDAFDHEAAGRNPWERLHANQLQ